MDVIKKNNYRYLQEHDLTVEMQRSTARSYSQGASAYAALAARPEHIDAVWKNVISPHLGLLASLKKEDKPKILLAAAGTLRDAVILALLNRYINVYAFDGSVEMLSAGEEMINWANVLLISALLYSKDKTNVNGPGLIHGIMNLIVELLENGNKNYSEHDNDTIDGVNKLDFLKPTDTIKVPDIKNLNRFDGVEIPLDLFIKLASIPFKKEYKQGKVEEVKERISIRSGLLQEEVYSEENFHLIFAIACLQHLNKRNELITAIDRLVNKLKVGGTFHFNVRLDFNPTAGENYSVGRVFVDDVLGEPRFYATMSIDELNIFKKELELKYPNCTIQDGDISPHPDGSKPMFFNIYITRNE